MLTNIIRFILVDINCVFLFEIRGRVSGQEPFWMKGLMILPPMYLKYNNQTNQDMIKV